jgi:uncharacterized MnhB-related membrane protein
MTMHERSPARGVPPIIHIVNLTALLLGGLILLLTAVNQTYHLVFLAPLPVLLAVYWRRRKDSRVAAGAFGLALALLGWILLCEHIVLLDNALGTQISRRLSLGLRLQAYVDATLDTPGRLYLEPCCDDPLTWHYRPGSIHRETFDCPACNAPYEVRVDETGYLNRPLGLMLSQPQIDLFWAGDSVLQGMGVPSVVEALRAHLPWRMWNLSIQAYSARQKVNALLTYALPKRPRWLIVEFYAGNDVPEAIRDDVCESTGDFRCWYSAAEVRRRAARHPVYRTIFNPPTDLWTRVTEYTTENFTLATTRYLIKAMKSALKARLMATGGPSASSHAAVPAFDPPPISTMPWPPLAVREGQWQAYLHAGMALTQQHYARLVATLVELAHRPTVILFYNPSPYELYRDRVDPPSKADQASDFQRETLRTFAHHHGWRFLDLTEPLRRAVQARKMWIFGRYDRSHWSPEGTALVAAVLAAELDHFLGP